LNQEADIFPGIMGFSCHHGVLGALTRQSASPLDHKWSSVVTRGPHS
jgi:hypothetical protein